MWGWGQSCLRLPWTCPLFPGPSVPGFCPHLAVTPMAGDRGGCSTSFPLADPREPKKGPQIKDLRRKGQRCQTHFIPQRPEDVRAEMGVGLVPCQSRVRSGARLSHLVTLASHVATFPCS